MWENRQEKCKKKLEVSEKREVWEKARYVKKVWKLWDVWDVLEKVRCEK